MVIKRREFLISASAFLAACNNTTNNKAPEADIAGADIYDAFSDDFYKYVLKSENFKVLGTGYGWSEGPAWDKQRGRLYFTDVPGNIAYSWDTQNGIETFLSPSGTDIAEGFREPGANGLLYLDDGDLLLCNHGLRCVQKLNPASKKRSTLCESYQGKKFNSPNDVIKDKAGNIYFTDPPYGLDGLDSSPLKELDFNGVYKLAANGDVTALITDMTFPNGVALSPDETTLYISQSDPKAPHLYALDLTNPQATKKRLVDFMPYMDDQNPGLPDGMVIDKDGNIFVTGPGGIYVVTRNGQILGRIKTGKASANCTFGEDGKTLFITNHDRLVKLKTQTRGLSWMS